VKRTRLAAALLALLAAPLLAACEEKQQAAAPAPHEITREAIGHYCNMIVADHPGPKGQVFLIGEEKPIWFSSVRDTIAFTMLPEEPKNIAAIYVNDMGRASWEKPEPATWIEARQAWYVVGSAQRGGMGAVEAVPFAQKTAAEQFVREHGGRIVTFAEMPPSFILGEGGDEAAPRPAHEDGGHSVGRGGRS
jgi:copper chaperone NosL